MRDLLFPQQDHPWCMYNPIIALVPNESTHMAAVEDRLERMCVLFFF